MDLDVFSPIVQGYVYKVKFKDTGEYYIGSRYKNIKAGIPPEKDFMIRYFTSSKVVEPKLKQYDRSLIEVEFVFKSTDPDKLYEIEHGLINEQWDDELLLNENNRHGASPHFKSPEQYAKRSCLYCVEEYSINGIDRHEEICIKNPDRIDNKIACQWCGKKCGIGAGTKSHEKICDKNPDRIDNKVACQWCGKEYKSGKGIKYHKKVCKKNPDRIDDKIACRHCGEEYKSGTGIGNHERICDKNPDRVDNKISCQWCGEECAKTSIKQHEKTCDKNPDRIDNKVACQWCGEQCGIGAGIKNHEKICDKNPDRIDNKVACRHCGKKCGITAIKYHEDTCIKNPDRIDNKVACRYCGKECGIGAGINAHEKTCKSKSSIFVCD